MPIQKFRIDPEAPPRLSAAAKRAYDATAESQIAYDEIPDLGDQDWARRVLPPESPQD